jgi:hypothetical protein
LEKKVFRVNKKFQIKGSLENSAGAMVYANSSVLFRPIATFYTYSVHLLNDTLSITFENTVFSLIPKENATVSIYSVLKSIESACQPELAPYFKTESTAFQLTF